MAILGIDTGGTFTDFVYLDGTSFRVHKVPSNPRAPTEAILEGITALGLMSAVHEGNLPIIHGTTVATNAALERHGARTAYITNKGLKDVLFIGRQTRPALYDLTPKPMSLPFEPALMLEVDCRTSAGGENFRPISDMELDGLESTLAALAPEAVAINLLFSFLAPADEIRIESRLASRYFVSRSSTVLPEYREYERGITTWVNAWLGPLMHRYLTSLKQALAPGRLSIMQSSGLTIAVELAATRAVSLLLSGPAGGLSASRHIGSVMDEGRLLTFDMGGTSTDVSLIDGDIRLTNQGHVAGFPVGVPMADIHTIGAGGGSVARIDEGELIQVGPESAGADPGPACYGKGGTLPTVTDANLVLGRLCEDTFLGGTMTLDRAAAVTAIEPLARALRLSVEEAAFGIIRIANEHMTQALRVISVQKGFDPREFALACFGGAGGLHFCDLAEALEMQSAIVPVHCGVLSALGMLVTPPGREMVRTHRVRMDKTDDLTLAQLFGTLESEGRAQLADQGVTEAIAARSLDLRYVGQTFTINLPFDTIDNCTAAFHEAHRHSYGHALDKAVELINLRIHIEGKFDRVELPDLAIPETEVSKGVKQVSGIGDSVAVLARDCLWAGYRGEGPCLVTEAHATTLIKAGWGFSVDRVGNLRLTRLGTT